MIFEAMIVDDEAPARVEIKSLLERSGRVQVVSEAVCLQEAIAKLRQRRIDVMFIDHNIAGANTQLLPEALPTLKKRPLLVYMTAFKQVQDDPFGIEPMGYLVKPVDRRDLDVIIAQMDAIYESGIIR